MGGVRRAFGSSPLVRTGGLALLLCLIGSAAPAATSASTQQPAGVVKAPELLAKAREALKLIDILHGKIEWTGAQYPKPVRWDVWQGGPESWSPLFRRDTDQSTFVIGYPWAVDLNKQTHVALAARRQPQDNSLLETVRMMQWLAGPEDAPRSKSYEVRIDEGVQVRRRDSKEELGVKITHSSAPPPPEDVWWQQTEEQVWIEAGTWLPVEFELTTRDKSETVLGRCGARYQYNKPMPAMTFSLKDALGEDAVVVGWEDLLKLQQRAPIASQVFRAEGEEMVVEVRAVERLPRDHLLIVGYVRNGTLEPEGWLEARVRVQDGLNYRDYRLARYGSMLSGPWGGGSSGPPREPFFVVFAPHGYGSSGPATPNPELTFRAWGLWRPAVHPDGEAQDVLVKMKLPVPEGPVLVHELSPVGQVPEHREN